MLGVGHRKCFCDVVLGGGVEKWCWQMALKFSVGKSV